MKKLQNELIASGGCHRHLWVGEWPAAGLSREAAARFVGVSPAMFDRLVREGVMPRPIPLVDPVTTAALERKVMIISGERSVSSMTLRGGSHGAHAVDRADTAIRLNRGTRISDPVGAPPL